MWGALALMVSAIFAGAALYVTFVEQPARLTLDDDALLAEWKPAYERGAVMQASLAVLGCAIGLLAWLDTGRLDFPGRRARDDRQLALHAAVHPPDQQSPEGKQAIRSRTSH